jgi:DNA-binding SARP family transcriptional activator
VLGPFEVEGFDATALGSRKARTLLKMLVLARGAPVSAERLADGLWGDQPPAKPADQVSVLVSRLRGVIGADRISRVDAGYRLDVDWIDLDALEELVAESEQRLASGAPAAARAAATAALALARGALLPDEPDAEWAEADRAAAERLATRATQAAAAAAVATGDLTGAADLAAGSLERDPYDEVALRTLMRALAGAGRPASALAAYARVREQLGEDLGVDPSPETEALHTEILLAPDHPATPPATALADLPGRDDAFAALDRHRQQGGVVVVTGEAGIGKTRLLATWADRAAAAGAVVLAGRCDELARALPLQAVMDALAAHLAMLEPAAADAALGPEETVLAPLLGRLPAEGERREIGEGGGQALVFGALLTVLGRIGGARPTVLLIDDVHLAGDMTLEWLHFVVRRQPTGPLLVVATARSEEAVPLPAVPRIELGPLDLAATAALVGEDRAAELHARSGGHPLFLVELAAAGDGELPASVTDAVAARCDRAGAAAETLRAAAVLGPDVDLDLLAGVLRASPVELLRHLEEGVRRRLLAEQGEGFAFTHDLLRQALITGTNASRRMLLHREAGRVLAARPDVDPRAVAHHARLGGDRHLAATALVDAATTASDRYDQVEALRLIDEAIGLDDTASRRMVRARVRLLGNQSGGALEDALAARDKGAGAEALELAAWASHFLRDFPTAIAYADQGAAEAVDDDVRAGCLGLSGWVRVVRGDLAGAEERLVASLAGRPTPHSTTAFGLGGLRMFQGQIDEGLALVAPLLVAPPSPQRTIPRCYAHMMVGMGHGWAGRAAEALAEFDALEAEVERAGVERYLGRANNLRAWVLRNLGDHARADEDNARALELAVPRQYREPTCHAHVDLATGAFLAGDWSGAAAQLDSHDGYSDLNHSLPWRHKIRASLLRARLALVAEDWDAAEATATDIVARAGELGLQRYGVLGELVVHEARLGRGDQFLAARVDELLDRLAGLAGLEAWWVTADLARRSEVGALRVRAEQFVAELAGRAGPYREALLRAADRRLNGGRSAR